jgi:tRNA(Arg) A34 adenosine deaminase TadA
MASNPLGDIGFMRRAMALAREGGRKPGANPIGCVIVLDGAIIGEGYNDVVAHFTDRATSPASIR